MNTDAQDAQDMARLSSGHDAALNELMERHGTPLFHYLIRQLQNEADAEEIAQEAFVRVYQHRAKYQTGKKFSTWLYAIATNLMRDRFRSRKLHLQVSLDAEDPSGNSFGQTLPDLQPTPSETVQNEERASAVRRAVLSLPEDLRTPLILVEYERNSQAEIAIILNCSVKAVETRIYRARLQLRSRLEKLLKDF